jgi:hypothetical protein
VPCYALPRRAQVAVYAQLLWLVGQEGPSAYLICSEEILKLLSQNITNVPTGRLTEVEHPSAWFKIAVKANRPVC